MIKSITFTNYLGESIELELARPEKSGFVIESVEGLGAGKATVNVTEIVTNDGAIHNSSRITARNILLNLKFYSDTSIEDVRLKTYRYFPLKKNIKMVIETDNRICEIEGIVESNEPNIFSKEEGTTISIICPDPSFYALTEGDVIDIEHKSSTSEFEFPFSNESLVGSMMVFGSLLVSKEQTILYKGDAETGVRITVHALGDASDITIRNLTTNEIMRIDTDRLEGGKLYQGDDIVISTVKGKKSVTLFRNGKSINILNCLARNTDWFQLTRGSNTFTFDASGGLRNLEFKIESRVVYEGV